MRSIVTISLANHELATLFERRLSGNRLFMDQVTLKLGLMVRQCMDGNVQALVSLMHIQEKILNEIDYVFDETDKYQGRIDKRSNSTNRNKVEFTKHFKGKISCSNEISFNLVELFNQYDELISKLKHFLLIGGFEDRVGFFAVKSRYQKRLNRLLSEIVLKRSKQLDPMSLDEYIAKYDGVILPEQERETLIKAINSSFGPAYSPHVKSQKIFKLKKMAGKQLKQSESA